MALTANVFYETRANDNRSKSFKVKNAEVIYYGAMVNTDANGLLVNSTDTANERWQGMAMESVTGDTSASPPVRCRVSQGSYQLKLVVVGVADDTDIHDLVYCDPDENTFTLTAATNLGAIGRVVEHVSGTTCWVELFDAATHEAKL